MSARHPRILSVQSHVVHGCVGNKSSSLPLQLLGYEVDAINTVQFSNHTRYPSFAGSRLGGREMRDLVAGMDANRFFALYTHLLTGYVGSLEVLLEIAALAVRLRNDSPGIFITIDVRTVSNQRLIATACDGGRRPVVCARKLRASLPQSGCLCGPGYSERL